MSFFVPPWFSNTLGHRMSGGPKCGGIGRNGDEEALKRFSIDICRGSALIEACYCRNGDPLRIGELALNGDCLCSLVLWYGDIDLSIGSFLTRSTLLLVALMSSSVTLGPRCFSLDLPIDLYLNAGY